MCVFENIPTSVQCDQFIEFKLEFLLLLNIVSIIYKLQTNGFCVNSYWNVFSFWIIGHFEACGEGNLKYFFKFSQNICRIGKG